MGEQAETGKQTNIKTYLWGKYTWIWLSDMFNWSKPGRNVKSGNFFSLQLLKDRYWIEGSILEKTTSRKGLLPSISFRSTGRLDSESGIKCIEFRVRSNTWNEQRYHFLLSHLSLLYIYIYITSCPQLKAHFQILKWIECTRFNVGYAVVRQVQYSQWWIIDEGIVENFPDPVVSYIKNL